MCIALYNTLFISEDGQRFPEPYIPVVLPERDQVYKIDPMAYMGLNNWVLPPVISTEAPTTDYLQPMSYKQPAAAFYTQPYENRVTPWWSAQGPYGTSWYS